MISKKLLYERNFDCYNRINFYPCIPNKFYKKKCPPFVPTPYSMLFVFKYNFLSVEVQNQWLLCRREPDVV